MENPAGPGSITSIDKIVPPSHLKFEENNENERSQYSSKFIAMKEALIKKNATMIEWTNYAKSCGGLVDDSIRKYVWPIIGGVQDDELTDAPLLETLTNHPGYNQVKLDVDRSLKRFPPGIPYEKRVELQDQLTVLILRVIMKYPDLHYYQGYHDIAITLLLVCGEKSSFPLLCRLSQGENAPFAPFMKDTLELTQHLLNYLYPLINKENSDLGKFLHQSQVGTMYALPWFLTWFGHSLNRYTDVVRLYDYFLCAPPMFPVYVTASIVFHRAKDILQLDCDMASVHLLLSHLPEDLPFEDILVKAAKLYKKYPPGDLEKLVIAYEEKEKRQRKLHEEAWRKQIANQRGDRSYWNERYIQFQRYINNNPLLQIVPPRYRALIAATTLLVGAYAYYKFDYSPFGFVR